MSSFSVSFRHADASGTAARSPEAPAADAPAVCVLDLHGELDAHTAAELEAAFQKCLSDGHARIVVGGSGLQYISSAGLGVFMAFIEEVRERGGDIKIAGLQPRVYNVFDLLGFPVHFDITRTEDEAIARFAEAS